MATILMEFLYDPGALLYWRALEGLGLVSYHPEQVRNLISRLLYLLNEDSGSNGWGAAAALGEIGRHQIALVKEIIPMFVGILEESFSREPMLWGVGRLAEVHGKFLHEVLPVIVPFLTGPEPQVRALAAWGLGKARYPPAAGAHPGLNGGPAPGGALRLRPSGFDHRGPDRGRGPGGPDVSPASHDVKTFLCMRTRLISDKKGRFRCF